MDKPDNMPWLTPYLTVKDAKASLEFYEQAFGLEPGMTLPASDGTLMHAEMHYKGQVLFMMGPECPENPNPTPNKTGIGSPVGLFVYVDDVDAATQRALDAGIVHVSGPTDMFWGDRVAGFRDLDGHRWTLATKVAEFDPTNVPEM